MNSNNNNNNKTQAKKQTKKCLNPFSFGISDDFYDPFDKDIFGFENRMLKNFRNIFTDFGFYDSPIEEEKKVEEEKPKEVKPKEETKMEEEKEDEKEEEINTDSKKVEPVKPVEPVEPKEEEINTDSKKVEPIEPKEEEINTDTKMEEEKEEEINTNTKEEKKEEKENKNNGTFYSKVYYSSYNNLNGKPNEESYQSQTIKQMNDGHDISETKEAYKNSDGVQKTAYQRNLDGKTARFIKEKNIKTGKKNQKRLIKGIEENEIKDFNKTYNDYCKKCGFKKNFHDFDLFNPFGFKKQQITDGTPLLLHRLLF